ncbi:MAG: CmpA/NrtA family ABC transporter substrate-binding protein [Pseudomonadota bacterium]
MSLVPIHACFLPLVDACVLIVAKEMGFARDEGLDLHLVREKSWANVRDRLSLGHFDAAHMLVPMPIAAKLIVSPIALDVVAPMVLGAGGNAVTVSRALADQMRDHLNDDEAARFDPTAQGQALAKALAARKRKGLPSAVFGVVHPYSAHNYDLRYWLAANGISPQRDVEFLIIPPPLMPQAIESGTIDGFCVGEPWSSVVCARGLGQIITTKAQIWPNSPEKVLGVTERFLNKNEGAVQALLRALMNAAFWCKDGAHATDLADILSASQYLDVPADHILPSLNGTFTGMNGSTVTVPNFFLPGGPTIHRPDVAHGLWYYSQMVRWGHVPNNKENLAAVMSRFRTDVFDAALAGSHAVAASPATSTALFDDVPFHPDDLFGYVDHLLKFDQIA